MKRKPISASVKAHAILIIGCGLFLAGTGTAARAEGTYDHLGSWSEDRLAVARETHRKTPGDADAAGDLAILLIRKYSDTEDKGAHGEARDLLETALASHPENPRILAYKGLLGCVHARDQKEKDFAREGVDILDKALGLAPDDLEILYLNGSVSIEVPEKWDRRDPGGERLLEAARRIEKDASAGEAADVSLVKVYGKLAKWYRDRREYEKAVDYWNRILTLDPGSSLAASARKNIDKFSFGEASGAGWSPGR